MPNIGTEIPRIFFYVDRYVNMYIYIREIDFVPFFRGTKYGTNFKVIWIDINPYSIDHGRERVSRDLAAYFLVLNEQEQS